MDRPAESDLFFKLREKRRDLLALLKRINEEWVYEDLVYRYYHGSFKAYRVQGYTKEIVDALQGLAPELPLNESFMEIYRAGTGHVFDLSHNRDWALRGRPMLEAFFHARFMLETAARYGFKHRHYDSPPQVLDSGWAAFLYLYNLR